MKRLTPQQIEGLVRVIGQTREFEFNCAECQRNIGEFAERQIDRRPGLVAAGRVAQRLEWNRHLGK